MYANEFNLIIVTSTSDNKKITEIIELKSHVYNNNKINVHNNNIIIIYKINDIIYRKRKAKYKVAHINRIYLNYI